VAGDQELRKRFQALLEILSEPAKLQWEETQERLQTLKFNKKVKKKAPPPEPVPEPEEEELEEDESLE